jgi:prepilin signal peptidase PulO-like enzyme (type II secretory pathway)
MIDAAYTAHVVAFYPLMGLALAIAFMTKNAALARGVVVTLAAQFVIDLWVSAHPDYTIQPAGMIALIYMVAAAIVTIRRSGKLCGAYAIIFTACFCISAITFALVRSYSADVLFYQVHVVLGWATVLLTGWGVFNGGGGIYSADSVRRDPKLVDVAHSHSMER